MVSRLFISCKDLGYYNQSHFGENHIEKWDIRDLNLQLYAGDRVCFRFHNNEQKEVLLRLFQQKLKPKTGSFSFSPKTHIYSDYNFWKGTDKQVSLKENMESKLFYSRPWIGGHRKNLETLIDRLGLGGRIQHIPVKQLSHVQKNRFRVLMMITAKTKVILIDNLFTELDETSLLFILEWLEKYLGIVILFGDYPYEINFKRNLRLMKPDKFKEQFNSIISFSAEGFSNIIKN